MDSKKKKEIGNKSNLEDDGKNNDHKCIKMWQATYPREPKQCIQDLATIANNGEAADLDHNGVGIGLNKFEKDVAKWLGMEKGLFFSTATCAARAAILSLLATFDNHDQTEEYVTGATKRLYVERYSQVQNTSRSTTISVHYTSNLIHLASLRDGSYQREAFTDLAQENWPGIHVIPYGRMEAAASYSDVMRVLSDANPSRPGVVVIELPQAMNGGATMHFDDIRALHTLTRKLGVHMHLDGSRLWSVQPYYTRSFSQICELFDTVHLDFGTDLGAIGGAMLLGKADIIEQAARWRQRLGGLHSFFPIWIDAKYKWQTVGQTSAMTKRFDRLSELIELLHERVLTDDGPVRIVPRIPTSCMVHVYVCGDLKLINAAHQEATQVTGIEIWNKFEGPGLTRVEGDAYPWHFYEWTIGETHEDFSDDKVLQVWTEFVASLEKLQTKEHPYYEFPVSRPKPLANANPPKRRPKTRSLDENSDTETDDYIKLKREERKTSIVGAPAWWSDRNAKPPAELLIHAKHTPANKDIRSRQENLENTDQGITKQPSPLKASKMVH
eukprot:m.339164 g.339164  ORF g.339164 m.339164 type:complete len:555 (-) comp18691_c0_seq1:791-2455(-)